MTIESEAESQQPFAVRVLPWLVAAGMLAVYLITLNPWVSLANLPQVGKTTGWWWQPELTSPAYFVVTYPLRWLPDAWIPLALNLLSAGCAALTLGLLARSVALLPHDRTHEQRQREKSDHSLLTIRAAWLPPLLAAGLCGMQLTFWEHATNGTAEMFDLLLFAYVLRALLEYRIDGRESWLFRAALVYGAGLTNNFAMWGFLPVLLAALVWIRGVSFFNARFLGRMALWGLLGLSLYLLLPLLAVGFNPEPVGFWQALKTNLAQQKNILFLYPKLPTRNLDNMDWVVMVAVCVLPLLLFSIRWPSYFGDTSRLGIWMATAVFHVMFGLYLCVCVWMLFDPPFSPRQRGLGLPFLTFYFLAALSVGYFVGYFLLVFRDLPLRGRRPAASVRLLNRVVVGLVIVIAVIAPCGLLAKNLAHIRATNGPILKEYAAALAEKLPPRATLLSDDSRRLLITQAWLARNGRLKDYLALDTQSLVWPPYHRYLHREHPDRWSPLPDPARQQPFSVGELFQLMAQRAATSEIWYLHPSFGYYFEYFQLEPHGLVYQLRPHGTNTLLPPSLSAELLQENESFWAGLADRQFKSVLPWTDPFGGADLPGGPTGAGTSLKLAERAFKAARLPRQKNLQTLTLGAFYSRSLNHWGVEAQRGGDAARAGEHFQMARRLNPENLVAHTNLLFNQKLRAGQAGTVEVLKFVEDRFGRHRKWDEVMNENGPYDEPAFCHAQGETFLRSGLVRQAAECFDRVRELAPRDVSSRLRLAQLHLMARMPDQALALARELREPPGRFHLNTTNRADLLAVEARAHFARNEPAVAESMLEAALEHSPADDYLVAAVTSTYFETGRFTNALAVLDRQLQLAPTNVTALVNKGVVFMQANQYHDAIAPFTRALTLQPTNHAARYYRAICHLRSDQLDDAEKDYETLRLEFPSATRVFHGLGEISYRRRDTNAAIRHYEAYLASAAPNSTNAPPHPEEVKFVASRLKELKGEAPPK